MRIRLKGPHIREQVGHDLRMVVARKGAERAKRVKGTNAIWGIDYVIGGCLYVSHRLGFPTFSFVCGKFSISLKGEVVQLIHSLKVK